VDAISSRRDVMQKVPGLHDLTGSLRTVKRTRPHEDGDQTDYYSIQLNVIYITTPYRRRFEKAKTYLYYMW
jgi:hypothetical protein